MSAESFGELLLQRRLACGLTQEALAERAGMSDRSIRSLERGRNKPQRETAHRLADALELDGDGLDYFLSAAGPTPRRRSAAAERSVQASFVPPLPTTLLGRERELAEIGGLLTQPEGGVLTLTGPAGVGKTYLALEIARRIAGDVADGAVVVSLASLSNPALVLVAVLRALHLSEGSDHPLLRLSTALQEKRILLVLDNFEHLLDAAPDVAALRAACPDLQVLVTSRSPLRLQAEQIYPVPPLTVPHRLDSRLLSRSALEALEAVPAVRLFVTRARAVKPDFVLAPSDGWAVAEICRHLDGLPLAIELAAARAAILSPQALLVQLAHPLRLLTSGARDLPERQRTLRKAIAWSYDLLQPDQQVLFRRLGAFAGGCDLEAAEAVCLPGLSMSTLDGVAALAEANLLVAEEGDEPRFRMLDTIREFAVEQLTVSGDGEVWRYYAAYFLAMSESASSKVLGPEHAEMFCRLDRELDNIRAALGWVLEAGDVNTLARMASALFYYWYTRGYRSEGRSWLKEALARIPAGERSPERAATLGASGGLANVLGDFEGARRELEESAAIWRELGGGTGLSHALAHLGIAYGIMGDEERSWAACEESLATARAGGDLFHIGLGLHGRGVGLAWGRREFEAAAAMYEGALNAFRQMGSSGGMALVVNSLGDLARQQGNFAKAREYYTQSLELARGVASNSHDAIVLHNLGHTLHALGDGQQARERFRESLLLFRNMGDTRGVAECVAGLACIETGEHPELSLRWFAAARAAVAAIGTALSVSNEPHYQAALARARRQMGASSFKVVTGLDPIPLRAAVQEALSP